MKMCMYLLSENVDKKKILRNSIIVIFIDAKVVCTGCI